MVFGDSVINGGNLTDHGSLGTTILQDRLGKLNHKHVIVGNVSAGSWGPGIVAYVKQYGILECENCCFGDLKSRLCG
jgi:hypothetical protein